MFEESVSFIPSIWASMNSWFTPTVLFLLLNLMIGTIYITSSLATQKVNDQQKLQEHYGHYHHQQQLARSPSMLQRLKSINFYNYRSPETNSTFAQTPGANSHFTSHFNYEQEQEQPQWGGSPSMLQRLKSNINLYNYFSQESPALDKTQEAAADTHDSPNQEQEHHLEPEQDEEEEDHFQDQEQSLDEIYNQLKGRNVARTTSDTKPASGEILKKLPKKMKKSASSKSAFNHFKEEDIVEVEARRPATMKEIGNPKVTQVDDEGVDAKADDFIYKFKQQLKLQRIDSIIRYKETINRDTGK